MITIDDLKKLSETGSTIVINNLTINDYSTHVTIEVATELPADKLLYPWWQFDRASVVRADKAIHDRWTNGHADTGFAG